MLEHYFHSSYNLRSNRRNLRKFRMSSKNQFNNQQASHICLSNGNAIEIYKVSSQSVDLCIRKQFMCNIVKVQVVPSLHHDSDYVFILDNLGRYTFWRPGQGMRQTSNTIRQEDVKKRYYRQQLSPQEEQQFSGSSFSFNVKDTVGHIFFTIQNKLAILKVSVKAKQGLRIQNMRTYQIPYTRFRYVNCLQSFDSAKDSQVIIGIVQEIEEKTILKFHALDLQVSSVLIDEDSLSFKLQKVNILQFSSGQNDEIIVFSYDEISLYRYKYAQHLCNYRTKGNYGSSCYIPSSQSNKSQPIYIHLGYEVIVFTKSKLRNYGGLKLNNKSLLQNRGITESQYLGRNTKGQVVIGFVSTFNEVYFVVLRDQKWILLRKIDSLSSIFSIDQVNSEERNSPLVVVHSSSESCSQVSLVQICTPSVLQLQQYLNEKVIQNIEVVQQGESLVVSYDGESSLLTWSPNDKRWIEIYSFNHQNKQEVLACKGEYIAMRSGIYKYQLSQQQISTTLLIKQDNILSAVGNDSYMGYYTSDGTYKFFEFKTQSIARMRKNCVEEYLWHMIPGYDVMVSAAYNEMGELRILPVDKAGRKIALQCSQLVSGIMSVNYGSKQSKKMEVEGNSQQKVDETLFVDLVIGYHNGQIQVYSLEQNKTIFKFNIGNQMVKVSPFRQNHVIVYTSNRQFILSRQIASNSRVEYNLHHVQFSTDSQNITHLAYLPKFDKFLLSVTYNSQQNNNILERNLTLLQLKSIKLNQSLSNQQLSLELNSSLFLKTLFKAESNEIIPYTQVYNQQYLFIAVSQNVFKYSLKTCSLVKQQLHLLKEVVAINSLNTALIIAGVDFMDSGSIYIFDFEDLTIKSTYNMGPSSRPSSLQTFKSSASDKFIIRHETFVSIFQLESNGIITLLKTISTKTEGPSVQLNEEYNKILLTDPYRYLSVWDYDIDNKDILPVSKYFGPYMINETTWLDGSVVVGDRGGNLTILEFNLSNNHDLHKMSMTKVGEISVGEEIFTFKRSLKPQKSIGQDKEKLSAQKQESIPSTVYYGTSSGTIGVLKTIREQEFKLLKQIQLDALKYIDLKEQFSYEQWRKRLPQNDKLIDATLIKHYIDEFKNKVKLNQQDFYQQVKRVYERIMNQK